MSLRMVLRGVTSGSIGPEDEARTCERSENKSGAEEDELPLSAFEGEGSMRGHFLLASVRGIAGRDLGELRSPEVCSSEEEARAAVTSNEIGIVCT